jgi:hypothetical protein
VNYKFEAVWKVGEIAPTQLQSGETP